MAFIHRHRFPGFWSPNRAPNVPIEIDWSHPLARGLIACYIPGVSLSDLTGNNPDLTLTTNGYRAPSPLGVGVRSFGANSGAYTTPACPNLRRDVHMACVSIQWQDNAGSGYSNCPFGQMSNVNPFDGLSYEPTLSQISVSTPTGYGTVNTYTVNQAIPLGYACLVAAWRGTGGGDGAAIYVNGKVVGSVTSAVWTAGSSFRPQDQAQITMGTNPGNTATRDAGSINVAGYYYDTGASIMRADTVAWLNAEPFAMLRPVARRVYKTPSAGGGPITGTLAVTEANDTIVAAGGSVVSGALSVTEANDTIVAAGGVGLVGGLTITQAPQTLVAAGSVGSVSGYTAIHVVVLVGL